MGDRGRGGLTPELIKKEAKTFDLETVFRLSLCRKGISEIENLETCPHLVELLLTANCIQVVQGLNSLGRLKHLNLASNRIAFIDAASMKGLVSLEVFQLQDNAITSVDDLEGLTQLPKLRSLSLQNSDHTMPNRVCSSEGYRTAIMAVVPQLMVLDGQRRLRNELLEETTQLLRPQSMDLFSGQKTSQPKFFDELFVAGSTKFTLPPIHVRPAAPVALAASKPWIEASALCLPRVVDGAHDEKFLSGIDTKRFTELLGECKSLAEKAAQLTPSLRAR